MSLFFGVYRNGLYLITGVGFAHVAIFWGLSAEVSISSGCALFGAGVLEKPSH